MKLVELKFRSIELFGISASGKTFTRKKIKKKLNYLGYEVLDSREIIIKNIQYFTKLNLKEKLKILYFNFLLIFNIKTTLWNATLNNISSKYLKKRQKKYYYFLKAIKKLNQQDNKIKFRYHHVWIKELITASILKDDVIKLNDKVIYFPDEGFVQKIFLLNYTKNNNKDNLINNFLKKKIFCKKIINIRSTKNFILANMKKRKSNKDGWFLDEQEIKNMLKLENKIKKFLPLKIKIYNNHQRLQRNLFKSLL